MHLWIEKMEREMVELQTLLTAIPALAPENGGEGEAAKAEALIAYLRKKGDFDITTCSAADERVPGKTRPNVVLTIPGRDSRRSFWIMSHLDVVPPGDLAKWDSDPYLVVEKEGRLYGRGTEDNQQGLVSSVFAALALGAHKVVPPVNVKLLFAADEEVGSAMGIQAVLRDHGELFGKNDTFLVPDGGRPDGTMIEIAEKSLLWLKFSVQGKQVHASLPHLGKNAFLAGSDLVLRLARALAAGYADEDPIFDPPYSTFCPTKKEANVPNVNTIPGLDVFCFDCRVLPRYGLDEVIKTVNEICREIENEYGVTVGHETLQRNSSASTSADSFLVARVKKAVKEIHGTEAEVVGIGGNTVGAFLRNAGYDTVIWSTLEDTAHMPNENCRIENMVKDAKVMLTLMLDP
jgi:succinyl-diaminopimelate desuccinylase